MKKMLLIVPSLHQGGMEKVCAATARLLQPYFDVRVAIFDSREIVYDTAGVPVEDLQLQSRSGLIGKTINVFKRGRKLHRIKKKENIDISYSFGPTANLANIMAGGREVKWLGVRSYMDMANPLQIRLFCRFASRMICCSEAIRMEIGKKYRCDKAVTLSNPFDIGEVQALSGREEAALPWSGGRVLLSMGRSDVVKGYWHLVKSFALVHRELPDTKLMIVGAGDFSMYRKLAKELGVGDAVYFPGVQKNPYPYLKQGSLYILTSSFEGFPNALVEAMALGIPVIATNCMTGPREILQDKYGVLIPNMGEEPDLRADHITEGERDLAARVVALLGDEDALKRYRGLSLARAAMYSNEAYVENIRRWAEE